MSSTSSTPTKLAMASKPAANKNTMNTTTPQKDDVAHKLEKIELKTKAINLNNVARVANSQLTSATDKLHVLYSLKTGRPIERFPETSKDIAKLTDTLVDAMLLALETERTGSKEQKLERLRVHTGLKPNPP